MTIPKRTDARLLPSPRVRRAAGDDALVAVAESTLAALAAGDRGPCQSLLAPDSLAARVCAVCGVSVLARMLDIRDLSDVRVRIVEVGDAESIVEVLGGRGERGTLCLVRTGAHWRVCEMYPGSPGGIDAAVLTAALGTPESLHIDCSTPDLSRWVRAMHADRYLTSRRHDAGTEASVLTCLRDLADYRDVCDALLASGYEVQEYVSTANSDVLIVERAGDGRQFVVKLLWRRTPSRRERFEREVAVLRRLEGVPGVPVLYDSGIVHDTPFHITARVPGSPLTQACVDGAFVTPTDKLTLLRRVVALVAGLHDRDVLHRDVSPEHVYVSPARDVSLIDFGMSCATSAMSSEAAAFALAKEIRNIGLVMVHVFDDGAPVSFGATSRYVSEWCELLGRFRQTHQEFLPMVEAALAADPELRDAAGLHPRIVFRSAADLLTAMNSYLVSARYDSPSSAAPDAKPVARIAAHPAIGAPGQETSARCCWLSR